MDGLMRGWMCETRRFGTTTQPVSSPSSTCPLITKQPPNTLHTHVYPYRPPAVHADAGVVRAAAGRGRARAAHGGVQDGHLLRHGRGQDAAGGGLHGHAAQELRGGVQGRGEAPAGHGRCVRTGRIGTRGSVGLVFGVWCVWGGHRTTVSFVHPSVDPSIPHHQQRHQRPPPTTPPQG